MAYNNPDFGKSLQRCNKLMIDLSIIIVSYGTSKLTVETVASIEKSYPSEVALGKYEVLVSDNNSPDDTLSLLKEYKKTSRMKLLMIIPNKENFGFSKANNIAVKKAKGRYLLFLNPDTIMRPATLPTLIEFMDSHKDAGAVTCRIDIPGGGIDEASHRGFPTPWNAFTHFSGLEKMFPHSRLFAGYTRGWENLKNIHTIPSIVGAFMLVRREAGEQIGWWDEDYFFYGEDLDFCYKLGEKKWKIYYVPDVSIVHYGGVSSGIKKHSQHLTTADMERKKTVQYHRFEAMKIFYKKHYMEKYPRFVTWAVMKGIDYLHNKSTPKIS